jgi:hypothetical protein
LTSVPAPFFVTANHFCGGFIHVERGSRAAISTVPGTCHHSHPQVDPYLNGAGN